MRKGSLGNFSYRFGQEYAFNIRVCESVRVDIINGSSVGKLFGDNDARFRAFAYLCGYAFSNFGGGRRERVRKG